MSTLIPLPPTPLGRYRHYKGGEYEVMGVARHSETQEPLVVYRPLDDTTTDSTTDTSTNPSPVSGWWVRPHAMFFETVFVRGMQRPRFEKIQG